MKKPETNMTTKRFNPATLSPEFMQRFTLDQAPEQVVAHQFLLPGQLLVTKESTMVSTILGSCVAICLWDQRLQVGGLNHYLLPEGDGGTRYGNVANVALLDKMLALGCSVRSLQAKVFGGAHTFSSGNPEQSLGGRNIHAACEFLRQSGIPILDKDVSGKLGRKILYNTGDGTVSVKILLSSTADPEGMTQQ
jgi:chemotaxis protein CheD